MLGESAMKKTILLVCLLFLLAACERNQKSFYDSKADVVGTNRTATVYSTMDGKLLRTFRDKSMVLERQVEGGVSLWLGSINKKVYIINATVIVEDN